MSEPRICRIETKYQRAKLGKYVWFVILSDDEGYWYDHIDNSWNFVGPRHLADRYKITPHPEPDKVWAEYCAWRMTQ